MTQETSELVESFEERTRRRREELVDEIDEIIKASGEPFSTCLARRALAGRIVDKMKLVAACYPINDRRR